MAKSFKYKDNVYLDAKGIVHNKKSLDTILTSLTHESGLINSNQMTNGNVGSEECKYYDLTFKNNYNNPPTIITTFISTAEIAYYGWVKTYVVEYTNTKARLVLSARLNDTIAKVGYLVISND